MADCQRSMESASPRRAWLSRLGLVGVGMLLGPAILLGPFGSFAYAGGLLNIADIFAGLLAVAVWVSLLVYALVRVVVALRRAGPRRSDGPLWMIVIAAVLLSFCLHFTEATPRGLTLFARGFERRLEVLTDIDAIQAWVVALDPNGYAGEPREYFREVLEEQDQPPVVACLDTDAWIELDEAGRPRLRLRWDASKAGFWGIVVGRQDMATPPPDYAMYGELTYELRRGVYFWFEEG